MGIIDSLSLRRSYYDLNRNIEADETDILTAIDRVTELVPDAFNMKSARVVVALGANQDRLWDEVYEAFGGQVKRKRIDGFKKAYGTVLFFIDTKVVAELQARYPLYADNFTRWAQQSNGMLQINIWTALRELGLGASLQHYNPVIDDRVKALFDLPEEWELVAQMPFGAIGSSPEPKEPEDIRRRVIIAKA